jgi:hypothetical protein
MSSEASSATSIRFVICPCMSCSPRELPPRCDPYLYLCREIPVFGQRVRLLKAGLFIYNGYHPSAYYHSVLKKMTDPRRPWRRLEWRRIIDFYHACQYVQQLADTLFGAGAEAQQWAKQMRHVFKAQVDGVSRVLKSASALRRRRGLCGQAKLYNQAYAYLKKRTQWMRYQTYKRQHLPLGSGITEAACKIVFTQRLKRSGMSWTIEGGQVILDLRVVWLSRVWDEVHQRYLASKPMPVTEVNMTKGARHGQQAA